MRHLPFSFATWSVGDGRKPVDIMSKDLIGVVDCGNRPPVDEKQYLIVWAVKYVPLDAHPEVIKHYWGGASSTQQVYIAIDIDKWRVWRDNMRNLYRKLADKYYGKRLIKLAKDYEEQDYYIQEELDEAERNLVKDFVQTGIKELRKISSTFDRYALSVEEDVKASRAYQKVAKPIEGWRELTTVNNDRCDYDIRMSRLFIDWDFIAGVKDFREPWND